MRVTISQSFELGEIPDYLQEQGTKIAYILEVLADSLRTEYSESVNQERFLGAAHDLEELRLNLSNLDVRVRELQQLCSDYQSALIQIHSQALQEQAAQESSPPEPQPEPEPSALPWEPLEQEKPSDA